MKKVFVHRYKWNHDSKRRKYRKLQKKGKVKLIETRKDGWLYGIVEEEV